MNLINKIVTHEGFGKGNIVKCDDSYVEVDFPSGQKKFAYPDAFGPYLTLEDEGAASFVDEILEKKKEKRRKKALEKERKRALEEEQRRLRGERLVRRRKIHPRLQSVFWCDTDELEDVFTEWEVFTGLIKSGKQKGQPRKIARLNQHSGCLLTRRDPDMAEEDRYILGVFMVDDSFSNKLSKDGFIPAHPDYRIRLTKEESEKMLFWNYYLNRRHPHRTTWNSGRQRYFDNIWMAQILQDIVSLRKETEGKEYAEKFFNYFCRINRINVSELEKPNGALIRMKKVEESSTG